MKAGKNTGNRKRKAFALILAIVAMSFMVLLALTLSSLVASKLRLLNAQKDARKARSNALLGMSVAISELQRTMGKDNAVTFSSAIFDEDPSTVAIDGVKSPYLTGAMTVAKEFSGVEAIDAQNEMRDPIDSLKNDGTGRPPNLNWLVSSAKKIGDPRNESVLDFNSEVVRLASYRVLQNYPDGFGEKIDSVLKGEKVDVFAGKIKLDKGCYAWWVSDESQKAKINLHRPSHYLDMLDTGDPESFSAPADRRILQISNLSFLGKISEFNLNPFLPEFDERSSEMLSKMNSIHEVALLNPGLGEWGRENQNDFTMSSMSIPVDVTQGRLKEDLSVYLQKDGNDRGLRDSDPIIRGHSSDLNYTGPSFGIKNYDENIPRMGLLRDWATMLQDAGEKFEDGIEARPHVNKKNETKHGLYPVVTNVAWTYRLAYDGDPAENIGLHLAFYPRIIIWNPHNVTIKPTDYLLRLYMPMVLEMGVICEGYSNGLNNGGVTTGNYISPLITRYDALTVAAADNSGKEIEYRFHPYRTFEITSDVGASGAKYFQSNKTSKILFSHFLKGRGMRHGKGSHSENKGSVQGAPVINMQIPNLELKPGETLELCASDGGFTMQRYDPRNDTEIPSGSNYPKLIPGVTAQSGKMISAGMGILINTGIELASRENPVNLERFKNRETLNREFVKAVKPEGSDNNPSVAGNWRVAPVNSADGSDTDANKSGYAYIGYELWKREGGNYEYLTNFDTTMLSSGGGTHFSMATPNNKGFLHTTWLKTIMESLGQKNFWHHAIFSVFFPDHFTIGYAWNTALSPRSSFNTSIEGNDNGYGTTYARETIGGTDKNPTQSDQVRKNIRESSSNIKYLPFELASVSEIEGSTWGEGANERKRGMGRLLLKADNSGPGAYHNDIADGDNCEVSFNSGGFAQWASYTIPTLTPPKDKGFESGQDGPGLGGMAYMPAYMAHSNFIRDNGNAVRVDARHGHNLMAQAPSVGWTSLPLNQTLFSQTHRDNWVSHPINRSSSYQYIENDGDWDYTRMYGDEGNTRFGSAVLVTNSIGSVYNNRNFWGRGDNERRPYGFVVPVYQYARSQDDLMSLGVFSNANLSAMMWQPAIAFGESWASPFLRREEIVNSDYKVLHENELIDISYMLNASMWDRFYLSTIPQTGLEKPFAGMRMPNTRHILVSPGDDPADLYGSSKAYATSASKIMVEGAFNVNSTSYEAWRAFLGGMLGVKKKTLAEGEYPKETSADAPEEFFMPNPGNLNTALAPYPSEKEFGYRDAAAGRNISEAEIDELAREIVAEVKRRAPFFSIADFVNRRLMKASEAKDEDAAYKSLMGTMAAAIARAAENYNREKATVFNSDYRFSKQKPEALDDLLSFMSENTRDFVEQSAMAPDGKSFRRVAGLPGAQLLQSQLLAGIGPFITVRGDTFTIRAFGEYVNPVSGESYKAYCEALVQRGSETVDPDDDIVAPAGEFGRKFKVVSFRWLTPAEL